MKRYSKYIRKINANCYIYDFNGKTKNENKISIKSRDGPYAMLIF